MLPWSIQPNHHRPWTMLVCRLTPSRPPQKCELRVPLHNTVRFYMPSPSLVKNLGSSRSWRWQWLSIRAGGGARLPWPSGRNGSPYDCAQLGRPVRQLARASWDKCLACFCNGLFSSSLWGPWKVSRTYVLSVTVICPHRPDLLGFQFCNVRAVGILKAQQAADYSLKGSEINHD